MIECAKDSGKDFDTTFDCMKQKWRRETRKSTTSQMLSTLFQNLKIKGGYVRLPRDEKAEGKLE